jgi:hypothetical protein
MAKRTLLGVLLVLVGVMIVAAVTACGSSEVMSRDPVEVRIRQVMPSLMYMEGGYSYIRIERQDGDTLLQRRLRDAGMATDSTLLRTAVLRLAPGEYRVVSFQRSCDGLCDLLDPPSEQCARSIRVEPPHAVLAVTVFPVTAAREQACGIELG